MPHPDELAWLDDGTCVRIGPKSWESMTVPNQHRMCRTCPVERQCRDFMAGTFRGDWKPRQVSR